MNKKVYKEAMDDIHASNRLKRDTLDKIKDKKNNGTFILKMLSALCVFVFVLGVVQLNRNQENINFNVDKNNNIKVASSISLPTLDSYDKLKEILENNIDENEYYLDDAIMESATESTNSINGEQRKEASMEFSETNTQVKGVDEADIVKTDGEYIYYITNNYSNRKLVIIDAKYNEIINEISYDEFNPYELFIYKNKLVVIGNMYTNDMVERKMSTMTDVAYIGKSMTTAIVYDITNKTDVNEIRRIEIEGDYISSRMINENVYMICSKNLYRYYDILESDDIKPSYRDTAISEDYICKEYNDIYYFPDTTDTNYLNIAGFSTENLDNVNVETFLGAGSNIYCSNDNIYITRNKYNYKMLEDSTSTTSIYKIGINGINLELKAQTELEGYVNNQFSLDEYNGNLRVALTKYNYSDIENDTTNNLYVLNDKLECIGKIENMAVGEKIYSVRFIGNKGYVVTFKQIDPLFVIDLSEPTNPKIAGELKIPGYSSYLHPYDENHIIGLGFNTKETEYGATTNNGMKMSMFDVTDPLNPIEMFNIDIGDERTYSEATYNHKAIMYSKEKNMMAFPINSYYNKFESKAIIYNIDLNKGFTQLGEITNIQNERESYKYNIDRIIYIGENFYTFSKSNVKVTNMNTFEEIKIIEL